MKSRINEAAMPNAGTIGRIMAFSLVELLVVIAVIGVLSGLLFSSLRIVSSSAGTTRCASGLRQCAAGIEAYAGENDGLAFNWGSEGAISTTWARKTAEFLSIADFRVAACPVWPPYSFQSNRWYNAYGFRYSTPPGKSLRVEITDGPLRWIYFRWNQAPSPSSYAIISDNCGSNPAYPTTYGAQFSRWEFSPALSEGLPHFRHRGKMNLLYVDGHVGGIDVDGYRQWLIEEYANPLIPLWGIDKNGNYANPVKIN